MGWGDWVPGKVTNRSSQSVLCLVSYGKDENFRWNFHELEAGWQSNADLDVDGVRHAGGTFILEANASIRSGTTRWIHLSGAWGHLEVLDNKNGVEPRPVVVHSGSVDVWTDAHLESHGGAATRAPWPPQNQPVKL